MKKIIRKPAPQKKYEDEQLEWQRKVIREEWIEEKKAKPIAR